MKDEKDACGEYDYDMRSPNNKDRKDLNYHLSRCSTVALCINMDVAHKAKLGVTPDASPNHPTHGRNKHHRLPPHSFPWSKLGDHVCHMSQRSNNKPKTNWEHSNIYQDFNPPLEGYVRIISKILYVGLCSLAKKSKEKPPPLWRFSRTNRCLSLCHILVEPP